MRTRRRDYTAAATQPSTSLPEALTVKPIVPMSGTKRIKSCNAKCKGSKKSKKKKCITTTGLWDRHIPTEILEGILSRLGLHASAVCKTWCESAVSVRKLPCRPWLLHPIDDWTIRGSPYLLLDPLKPHHDQSQKYNLDFPHMRFTPGGMSCSRDGWVLAKSPHLMYAFFFSPFTKKLFVLPLGSIYHLMSRLAFSAAPTSTSCVVISYSRIPQTADFLIETWRPGEATWTTHRFENSVLRRWDKCVFSNGVFYFLSTCGCLGVFDPCEATWNLLPVKPLLFPEVDSPVFLMEHEGDIFVMCSRLDSNHMVFKLNMKQNVWEEKRDLGGLTVFASCPGSFIRACLSAEEMNRIYPSFTDFYRRGIRCKTMVGWQRNLQLIRQIARSATTNSNVSTANYSSLARSSESPFSKCYLQGLLRPTYSSTPLHHYLQQVGISTSRKLKAGEEPVSSPLSSPALLGSGKEEDEEQKIIPKRKKVQAVLKAIKQSPKKVNLVAALVRGMRVEDALMQLQVTVKRASLTVYRVIHAARANASHNHGLDPDRLIIAEAFVGKGLFKKRISIHGKGKCGLMIRPECRLTVIVRETTPEEEAEIAKLKVHNFRKLTKRERRLNPTSSSRQLQFGTAEALKPIIVPQSWCHLVSVFVPQWLQERMKGTMTSVFFAPSCLFLV